MVYMGIIVKLLNLQENNNYDTTSFFGKIKTVIKKFKLYVVQFKNYFYLKQSAFPASDQGQATYHMRRKS